MTRPNVRYERYPSTVGWRPRPIGAAKMTLCIAAVARDEDEPRIVLCSDSKLSAGYAGSNNQLLKVIGIGYGWVAQFAGNPGAARDAIARICTAFDKVKNHSDSSSILSAVETGLLSYQKSPLFRPKAIELLLTGFIGQEPMLLMLDPDMGLHDMDFHACIGEGATAASLMLNFREYGGRESLARASYLVYEAKRFAEHITSVGRKTTMVWLRPLMPDMPKHYVHFALPTGAGVDLLRKQFEKTGPQDVPANMPFDDELLAAIKEEKYVSLPRSAESAPTAPKRGQKRLPPSRE